MNSPTPGKNPAGADEQTYSDVVFIGSMSPTPWLVRGLRALGENYVDAESIHRNLFPFLHFSPLKRLDFLRRCNC